MFGPSKRYSPDHFAEKADLPQTPILSVPSSFWTSRNCEKYVSIVYKVLLRAILL